jgi:predicted Zn-dependent protease
VPAEYAADYQTAKRAFDHGDYPTAERLFAVLAAKLPDNLQVHSTLGTIRFGAQDWNAAGDAFRRAVAIAPGDDYSHGMLGLVYFCQGHKDDAVNEFTKALAINRNNKTAQNFLPILMRKDLPVVPLVPHPRVHPLGDFYTPQEKSRFSTPQFEQVR